MHITLDACGSCPTLQLEGISSQKLLKLAMRACKMRTRPRPTQTRRYSDTEGRERPPAQQLPRRAVGQARQARQTWLHEGRQDQPEHEHSRTEEAL